MTRNGKIALVLGIIVAIVVGVLLSELVIDSTESRNPGGSSPAAASVGGPFSLVTHEGKAVTEADFRGRYMLLYFGFTFCPDVCPMTLAELAQAQRQLEDIPEGIRPRVLFISVDPERDSPERIGEYLTAFHPDTIGATADLPHLEEVTRSMSLVFMKVPPPEGARPDQYSIDHSSAMAVLDPQARMAGVLQGPLDPAAIAADLRMLTEASRR